jgi:hypothetical protein
MKHWAGLGAATILVAASAAAETPAADEAQAFPPRSTPPSRQRSTSS